MKEGSETGYWYKRKREGIQCRRKKKREGMDEEERGMVYKKEGRNG